MIPHTYKQSFNLCLSNLLTYLHSAPKVINVFLSVNSFTHDVCNASGNKHTIQVQKQHRWVLLHIWRWMPETVKEIWIKLHTLKYTHLQSKPFKSVSIHGTVCVHYSGVHLCTLFRCSSVLNVSPSSLPHGICCTMLLHTLPSTVIKIVINYPHLAIHCNNYPDYSIVINYPDLAIYCDNYPDLAIYCDNYPDLVIYCDNYPDLAIYCDWLPGPCHLLW